MGWGEEGRWEASRAQLPSAPVDWAPATPILGSVPSSPVAPCSLRGEVPAARGLGVCGGCVLAELHGSRYPRTHSLGTEWASAPCRLRPEDVRNRQPVSPLGVPYFF